MGSISPSVPSFLRNDPRVSSSAAERLSRICFSSRARDFPFFSMAAPMFPVWIASLSIRAKVLCFRFPCAATGRTLFGRNRDTPAKLSPATTALRLIPCPGRLSVMIRPLLSQVRSGNTVSEPRSLDDDADMVGPWVDVAQSVLEDDETACPGDFGESGELVRHGHDDILVVRHDLHA